jgi:hypothetical protein
MMSSLSPLSSTFYWKWHDQTWYPAIETYLDQRYSAIEARFIETLRFVELHPDNRSTFSYEYAGILRDAGSVFDSTMRKLAEGDKFPLGERKFEYDMGHYRSFLSKYVITESFQGHSSRIALVALELVASNDPVFLQPFLAWEKVPEAKLEWWDAFNDVKHSDMDKFRRGNLLNCLNALAALATLKRLVDDHNMSFPGSWQITAPNTGLFGQIGHARPEHIKLTIFGECSNPSEAEGQTTP